MQTVSASDFHHLFVQLSVSQDLGQGLVRHIEASYAAIARGLNWYQSTNVPHSFLLHSIALRAAASDFPIELRIEEPLEAFTQVIFTQKLQKRN